MTVPTNIIYWTGAGRINIWQWQFLTLLAIAFLFSIPLVVIIASVLFPAPDIWSHLYQTVLSDYLYSSLVLMIGVSVCSLLLGVIPAWLVTMYRFPMSRYFEWSLLLPMAMPAYIVAYSYTGLLDVTGPVQYGIRKITGWQYRDYWFPEIRSLSGAIAVLSIVLYPYVYLLARAAFIEQSVCVLEVSRTLGCNSVSAFRRVGLPLARPAIVVGLSLVMMETLADYGTVQYFGVATFTMGIFRVWFGLGEGMAAAQLSVLLFLLVSIFIYLEKRSRRISRYHHTSSRYSDLLQRPLHGRWAVAAFCICLFPVTAGFLVPFGQMLIWSISTYDHVVDSAFCSLLVNSFSLALLTAVLAVSIALLMTYVVRRQQSGISRLLVKFVSLGYAIPGTVIAVGVLIPLGWFDNWLNQMVNYFFAVDIGLLFSGTLFILVFAYLIRFLTISIGTTEAALTKIKPVIDEVAQSSGLSMLLIIKRVHLPMMKGSLLTALLLVFVDVLKELPATLILRPFNFNTLAVKTYELANEELLADAAVPALAIVLIGILPVIVISRSISESRASHVSLYSC